MVETETPSAYKRVWDQAVKLLSLRLHTKSELSRKLMTKKFDRVVIEQVLARLAELRLLNDEQFAEIYLENLIRFKTFGYYGLRAKLLGRGIDDTIIQKLLAEQLSFEVETKIAQKVVSKSHKEKDKLQQSLSRKGFRSQVIASVLQNMV